MTSKNEASETVGQSLEADLARAENLHAELLARMEELRNDQDNSEAEELRTLEPQLVEHQKDLRNTIEVIKVVEEQITLEAYARVDGRAPLITRILAFIATKEERTRQETMATFTKHGEKTYTIEDAVARLYKGGLIERSRRGVMTAAGPKAWAAVEKNMARVQNGLTQRVLERIEACGLCGRREILAHFTGEGNTRGAIDSSLQRLRTQSRVKTVRTGRTTTYAATKESAQQDAAPQSTATSPA